MRHGGHHSDLSLHSGAQHLLDRSNASKFDPGFEAPKLEIPKLEVPKFEPKLMDMIDKFRAQKCVELFDEHGKLFPSFDACWEFMKGVCHPGEDSVMDGDEGEVTSGEGFCRTFFGKKTKKKAEDTDGDGVPDEEDAFPEDPKEHEDSDGDGIGDNSDKDSDNDGVNDDKDAFPHDPKEHLDTDGDGIGDNADPDDDNDGYPDEEDAFPKDPNKHEADGAQTEVQNQTAPVEDGAPAGLSTDNATAPQAPQAPEALEGPAPKLDGLFHMDESLGAQEQGFSGQLVAHDDQETSTRDWIREYGPGAHTASEKELREMCLSNTRSMNWWCYKHGYWGTWTWRSAARSGRFATSDIAFVVPMVLSLGAFFLSQ